VWSQRGRPPLVATGALATALAALLIAPAAYSTTTWKQPVDSTFPAAGPLAAGGYGGENVTPHTLDLDTAVMEYVVSHHPTFRFQLLTESSDTAAGPILRGLRAAALGGYGTDDPALDGPGLGRLVAAGEARYVLAGGGYAYLGGNKAITAAERVCPQIAPALWHPASLDHAAAGFYLLDCRGQAAALARQPAYS
jgi:hypothetical protein